MSLAAYPVVVRAEFLRGGHATIDWARFRSLDHALDHGTLCAAFKLDPLRASFDLPSTARGVGSAMGLHGDGGRAREISGYVMFPDGKGGREPIAKLVFAREGDRFPDVNPFDRDEFLKLGTTVR